MRYLLRLRASVNPAAAAVIPAMHALVAAKAALSPVAGSAFLPFVRFSVFTVVPFLPASAFALLLGLSAGVEFELWSESSMVRDSSPLPWAPPFTPLPPAIWRLFALVVTVTVFTPASAPSIALL